MPRRDNEGAYSIAPTKIEERGKPVADHGDGTSTQGQPEAHQTEASRLPYPLSKSDVDIRSAAWKPAEDLGPLISLEQKGQGSTTSIATSAPMTSSNTGMSNPYRTSNVDFRVSPLKIKQRIKAPARAAGNNDEEGTVNNSTLAAADASNSYLMHDYRTPAETSNPNSMPIEMESSAGVDQEDFPPLRFSPQCVLLKPVPGANTHPDFIWKEYPDDTWKEYPDFIWKK